MYISEFVGRYAIQHIFINVHLFLYIHIFQDVFILIIHVPLILFIHKLFLLYINIHVYSRVHWATRDFSSISFSSVTLTFTFYLRIFFVFRMFGSITRDDFEWVYSDQPHTTRRTLMLKKYPTIKKLMRPDPHEKYIVTSMVFMQVNKRK